MMPMKTDLDKTLEVWRTTWGQISAIKFLDQTMDFYMKVRKLADEAKMPPFILAAVLESVAEEVRGTPRTELMALIFSENAKMFKEYMNKNFMKKEILSE